MRGRYLWTQAGARAGEAHSWPSRRSISATLCRQKTTSYLPSTMVGRSATGRQLLGEGSIARPIAARRRRQAESLMRPLGVVDMAEALELLIALRQIAPRPLSDHLALHGAIE